MKRQNWDATKYEENASFVSQLGNPVIQLLKPKPEETILDLGCGNGDLSLQIQNYKCEVLGIDSSTNMIATAISRGLNAKVLAAENINYDRQFDAVFTNAVLHWVSDINLVVSNVYSSLKQEGRFVGEFGGEGNIKTIVDAIAETFDEFDDFGKFNNPWYFPAVKKYKNVLENAGFKVEYITSISRPTPLKNGLEPWLKIFTNGIINHLNIEQQNVFISKVSQKVKPFLYSQDKGWIADYVRLRFKAIKD